MQIAPMTTSATESVSGTPPAAPAARRDGRPALEVERPLPSAIEPRGATVAPARPALPATVPSRWVEPERDYRSPTPIERARLLRAAYEASVADGEQRLLLAELMAHYRAWCLRNGKGDPFAGLSRE
jgi:hypothetical protein